MMAQRCAATFDDMCALYANTKAHASADDYRHFLRDTLRNRFCQLAPDSQCVKTCEPFDPTAPNGSNLVCKYIGKEPLTDVSALSSIDVGLPLPVNISPVYQGNCALTCNAKSPGQIEAQDPVVSECIRTGFCGDILRQICKDTDVASSPNALLQTYCGVVSSTDQIMPVVPASGQAPGVDTYGGTGTYADTYTYGGTGTYTYDEGMASKALTAIRNRLSSTKATPVVAIGGSVYQEESTDYSLVWLVVILVVFYAILYALWRLKVKGGSHRGEQRR
jgi:hypothetical protein